MFWDAVAVRLLRASIVVIAAALLLPAPIIADDQCDCAPLIPAARQLKRAVMGIAVPRKWVDNNQLFNDACELIQPFKTELAPEEMVYLLSFLHTDPRDYTAEQALSALRHIRMVRLKCVRNPDYEGIWSGLSAPTPNDYVRAAGINSALTKHSPQLLIERYRAVGVGLANIPAVEFLPVVDRAITKLANDADIAKDPEAKIKLSLAKQVAEDLKKSKLKLDEEQAANDLARIQAAMADKTPEKSKSAWANIERNAKDILKGGTDEAALVGIALGLADNDAARGGILGWVYNKGFSKLPDIDSGDDQPGDESSGDTGGSQTLEEAGEDEENKAVEVKTIEAMDRHNGETVNPLAVAASERIHLARKPCVFLDLPHGFNDVFPTANQLLIGDPVLDKNTTVLTVDSSSADLLASVICVVVFESTNNKCEASFLIDDGIVHFRPRGLDLEMVDSTVSIAGISYSLNSLQVGSMSGDRDKALNDQDKKDFFKELFDAH